LKIFSHRIFKVPVVKTPARFCDLLSQLVARFQRDHANELPRATLKIIPSLLFVFLVVILSDSEESRPKPLFLQAFFGSLKPERW